VTWPFDPGESFVTPERSVELERRRRGLTAEEFALPPTMVATFQGGAYKRLLERAGLVEASAREQAQPAGIALRGESGVGSVDGVPVRVTRLRVGAPAAALALEGAIVRGVRNVLVVGSAGSLQRDLPVGSTVIVTAAEREDGTSHHYLPAGEVVSADPDLTERLEAAARARGAAPVRGRSWTIDAPYRETVAAIRRHREAGVAAVEMEAAAIFAVARVRGIRAALIVAVSDTLFAEWLPGFDDPVYLEALTRAADAAMDVAATLR